jgi:hypothetical protein
MPGELDRALVRIRPFFAVPDPALSALPLFRLTTGNIEVQSLDSLGSLGMTATVQALRGAGEVSLLRDGDE